jgi:hypothetical protein
MPDEDSSGIFNPAGFAGALKKASFLYSRLEYSHEF